MNYSERINVITKSLKRTPIPIQCNLHTSVSLVNFITSIDDARNIARNIAIISDVLTTKSSEASLDIVIFY